MSMPEHEEVLERPQIPEEKDPRKHSREDKLSSPEPREIIMLRTHKLEGYPKEELVNLISYHNRINERQSIDSRAY